MSKKLLKFFFTAAIILLGVWISIYFWSNDSFERIKYLPISILISTVVYILIQIGKRYLFHKQNWWDWLYYIGLIGMMLGMFFATPENIKILNVITDWLISFLIIPGLIDLFNIIQPKKTV